MHSTGISCGQWQTRNEGAASHAGIECGVSRNNAMIATAESDGELLQCALHKVRLFNFVAVSERLIFFVKRLCFGLRQGVPTLENACNDYDDCAVDDECVLVPSDEGVNSGVCMAH